MSRYKYRNTRSNAGIWWRVPETAVGASPQGLDPLESLDLHGVLEKTFITQSLTCLDQNYEVQQNNNILPIISFYIRIHCQDIMSETRIDGFT